MSGSPGRCPLNAEPKPTSYQLRLPCRRQSVALVRIVVFKELVRSYFQGALNICQGSLKLERVTSLTGALSERRLDVKASSKLRSALPPIANTMRRDSALSNSSLDPIVLAMISKSAKVAGVSGASGSRG